MATHTVSAPNILPTPIDGPFGHSIFEGIGRAVTKAGAGIVGFLEALAASQQTAHHFNRLMHLNDAELAARGLAREGIANYVFEQNFGRK